ncbi:SF0329 family protein [Paenibacillus riograndensis]|uniref:Uncharacterized protein n=1 Tax=Paenibacillus riograndensis SBR5 TaxID=1073571 RepID=A0A0E4H7P8_9BACL|nr:hypothetical protein PRIO_0876 [Paenibacillus riograndensis SBR5]
MFWSKLKQQLEGFLSPALNGRVEYAHRVTVICLINQGFVVSVDKKNVLNMSDRTNTMKWYQTELEIKNDPDIQIPITSDEIEAVRKATRGTCRRIA